MSKNKPQLTEIDIDKLVRGKYQPRRDFDPELLEELAASIKSAGLLQPIVIRPIKDNMYEIIAGERRWRAAQLAGLQTVTCLVNRYSDEQAAEATAIENIIRVDLNPIEEAQAYQRLIDDFGYVHEEVAAAVGKSRAKITNLLRLLKLDSRVQQMLIDKTLSEGHGKVLAGLPGDIQYQLAEACIKRGWSIRKITQEAKKAQAAPDKYSTKPDPNLKALEKRLSDHIGCPISIDADQGGRGQLKIDFHNHDILKGIFDKLGYEEVI